MSGSSDDKSIFASFGQRHAEGVMVVFGFALCTLGTVATYKALQGTPQDRGRLLLFVYLTLTLIVLIALLYRIFRTKMKATWFWRAALFVSCWPLFLAWGIPSRYGSPIVDPTGTMAHRIPGYVLTVLWGLVIAWLPTTLASRRLNRSK